MNDFRALTQVPPQVVALAAAIREQAGDDDLAFVDTLDGETTIVGAARAAVRMILACDAHAEAARALAARYGARARDFEARSESTRAALLHFMGEIDARQLQLPEATLSLAEPSTQGLVEHGDADLDRLPPDCIRIKREADKSAIKAALNAGREVPGYSLANAKPVLKIRVGKAVES